MDTDSSLPPLLFLAASLLAFGWTSIVIAAHSSPTAIIRMVAVGATGQPLLVRVLRFGAMALTGISAVAFGFSLTNGLQSAGLGAAWNIVALIAAAAAVSTVLLAGVDLSIRRLAKAFPELAIRLAGPRRWLGSALTAPHANGNGTAGNNHGPESGEDETEANLFINSPLATGELFNLDQDDINMVRSISRMDDRDALHIMVPRLDVDAVEISSSMDTVVAVLVASKHTRLPVYQDTIDNVVGIVHISDVLESLSAGAQGAPLHAIMREPEFIAENMALDDLLRLMRRKSLQMGIVVDEYGGVEGIVTLEDVLEEIVGEIEDEFTDAEPDESTDAGDGSWLVNATLPIEDVAKTVGIALDYGEVNTIGGYVYTQLGRMPEVGNIVQSGNITIEVTQVSGRRIQQLRVRRSDAAPDTAAGQP